MVIENISESNVQRHLTMGSLSAFLADGTTITSAGGKLTAVGGGVMDYLVDGLNPSGTDNFPQRVPELTTDWLLGWDDDNAAMLARFNIGDMREGMNLDNAYVSHSLSGSTVTFTQADGGTSNLVLPAPGEDGTTVSANPVDVTPSLAELLTVGIGTTNYRIGHPHRGDYDNTRAYAQGDIVETGVGPGSNFWIARQAISAGGGAPSHNDLGNWWLTAGHGFWRGDLVDDNTEYDLFQGDMFSARNHVYIMTEGTLTDVTVADIIAADGPEKFVNQISVFNEGAQLNDPNGNQRPIRELEEMDFRGAGVNVISRSTENAEIVIPGWSNAETDARIASYARANSPSGTVPIGRGGTGATTAAAARTALGVSAFDLHDDVTTRNSTPHPLDRILSSDESSAGDPNEYLTISDVLNEMADVASTALANPANDDRFFLSNVSAGGRPLEYTTVAQLSTKIRGDIVASDLPSSDPVQIGATYSDVRQTAWSGTGITLPSSGWVRLVYTCRSIKRTAGSAFIPVDIFASRTVSTDGGSVSDENSVYFSAVWAGFTGSVAFGYTSTNEILMSCSTIGTQTLRLYDR